MFFDVVYTNLRNNTSTTRRGAFVEMGEFFVNYCKPEYNCKIIEYNSVGITAIIEYTDNKFNGIFYAKDTKLFELYKKLVLKSIKGIGRIKKEIDIWVKQQGFVYNKDELELSFINWYEIGCRYVSSLDAIYVNDTYLYIVVGKYRASITCIYDEALQLEKIYKKSKVLLNKNNNVISKEKGKHRGKVKTLAGQTDEDIEKVVLQDNIVESVNKSEQDKNSKQVKNNRGFEFLSIDNNEPVDDHEFN